MVLNCVPTPTLRGEMLLRFRRLLFPSGLLFLMLPLQCTTLSPYTTKAHLLRVLSSCGFLPLVQRDTPRVTMVCCAASPRDRPRAPAAAAAAPEPAACAHPRLAALELPPAWLGAAEGPWDKADDVGVPCPCSTASAALALRLSELRRLFPDPPPQIAASDSDTRLSNIFAIAFSADTALHRADLAAAGPRQAAEGSDQAESE